MLPPELRLRRGEDFRDVMRKGRRTSRGPLVVFVHPRASRTRIDGAGLDAVTAPPDDVSRTSAPIAAARFGLVVSRAVGNSVIRHRVSRRLREQLYQRRDLFPAGHDVVVRALPAAAGSTSAELGASLDAVVHRFGTTRRSAGRARRS